MNEPTPRVQLRGLFEQRLPEEALHRLWLGIARRPARSRPKPILLAACVAFLLSSMLTLGSYVWLRPAPLRLANHEKLPSLLAARVARTVAFDDGSQLELGAETRLDVLQSTERAFVVALRSGRARFSVVPGGPRAWRVECGPISVDVVGTVFLVERGTVSIRIEVERGRVLVSGQGVPDRVARLGATESLVVPLDATAPAAPAVNASGAVPPAPPAESAASPVSEPEGPTPHVARPRSAASTVSSGSALASPNAADAVDALLQQADIARREGAPARAAALLRRILKEHPNDRRVALAHFTLGRLYLDSLGEPQRAVVDFTSALESGVPGALAEDAEARLVQALARAGDRRGAESAAARYRAHYPSGRHLQDVDRWVRTAAGQ